MARIFTTILICTLFQVNGFTQLSNPGFESTFFDGVGTVPTNWTIDGYGSGLSSNSFSGSNALTVWNWYYYARAYAVNGNFSGFPMITPGQPTLDGGEPISVSPTALNGYYIYDTTMNDGAIDSAVVQITLSTYNSTSGSRDVVGFGELRLPVAANYTAFSIPVTYFSATAPDTVVVVLRSSVNGFCSMASSGTCLYLTVDDLALETSSGILDFSEKSNALTVFPNPTNGIVNLNAVVPAFENSSVQVFDALGKSITPKMICSQANSSFQIDLNSVKPGIYLVQLETGKEILTQKLIVE